MVGHVIYPVLLGTQVTVLSIVGSCNTMVFVYLKNVSRCVYTSNTANTWIMCCTVTSLFRGIFQLYCNFMGLPSYRQSIIDQNCIMWYVTVCCQFVLKTILISLHLLNKRDYLHLCMCGMGWISQIIFFFGGVPGIKPRALYTLNTCSATKLHPQQRAFLFSSLSINASHV